MAPLKPHAQMFTKNNAKTALIGPVVVTQCVEAAPLQRPISPRPTEGLQFLGCLDVAEMLLDDGQRFCTRWDIVSIEGRDIVCNIILTFCANAFAASNIFVRAVH